MRRFRLKSDSADGRPSGIVFRILWERDKVKARCYQRLSLGIKTYFNTTVWCGSDRKSNGHLDGESAGCPSSKTLFLGDVVRLVVGYKRLLRGHG